MTNGESVKKLTNLLKQLFQYETADLDYGIPKLMNFKRKEIDRFIEKDLIEATEMAFKDFAIAEKKALESELKSLADEINRFDAGTIDEKGEVKKNKETAKVKEYLEKRKQVDQLASIQAKMDSVYNAVYEFFSRYYEDGDFISKARYGGRTKYYLPYNGEEVLLHWATKDQYYVKTDEHLKKHRFEAGSWHVTFTVVSADIEANNVKTGDRYFILDAKEPELDENHKELTVFFNYRQLTDDEMRKYGSKKKEAQQTLVDEAIKTIMAKAGSKVTGLSKKIKVGENELTLLEKQINTYIGRNTTDYFIHKNLRGFLERELDFYLKNEVLVLDDIQAMDPARILLERAKLKAIRQISEKIIAFLAQIEEFQKRLWEKKKFVLKTDYVVTIDKLPEDMVNEVLKNKAQLAEWEELGFGRISKKSDLFSGGQRRLGDEGKPQMKKLPVDTKHFDVDFKMKLLEKLSEKGSLDEQIDGLLVKSENWQALNLLQEKYKEKVKCIYIDPPYNTGSDEFLYKDNYQHSSWLSMIADRLVIAKKLLKKDGHFYSSIDWNESHNFKRLLDEIFLESNFQREIIWNTGENISGFKSLAPNWIRQHDTIYYYTIGAEKIDNKLWTLLDLSKHGWNAKTKLDIIGENKDSLYIEKWDKHGNFIREPIKGEVKAVGDIWNDVYSFQYSFAAADEGLNFATQKPEDLIRRIVQASTVNGDVVLDFFAGTGTLPRTCQKLNRRWIGVEMGEHFEQIAMPELKKALSGKESGISQKVDWHGGGFFKYIYLEQYEDTLNNITFKGMTGAQQKTLEQMPDYFINYMLDYETRDSPSRLNIEAFEDPFNYQLKVLSGGERWEKVDLVETFNYLLGLEVDKVRQLEDQSRKYVAVFGRINGEKVAIIWRSIKGLDKRKDKKFIEQVVLKDYKPERIFVNGDSAVERAEPVEIEFKRRMGA